MIEKRIQVRINHKPYPIDIEMRPLWRISLIVLIIKFYSDKNKSLDLQRLNILIWMVIRTGKWSSYTKFLHEKDQPPPFMSSDQATYVAIEIAIEKRFITFEDGNIIPLDFAKNLYDLIIENHLFEQEIYFIKENAEKLSQTKIDKIMGKK